MPPDSDPAATSFHVELIAARDLRPMPWKNGGGVTREIASYPDAATLDTFVWRISLADVAQAGPFSSFSHIDRTLVVTRGGPMVLVNNDTHEQHSLPCWKPYRFRGETSITAQLPNGPTQDFNLMTRRGACVGQLDLRETAQTLDLEPDSTFLHCAAGSFTITLPRSTLAAYTLQTGDTLHVVLASHTASTLVIKPNRPDSRLIDVRLRIQGNAP
jgi:environmental stress-induced protein Ves